MSSEANTSEYDSTSKSGGGAMWLALVAAAGLTATAILIAKRYRSSSVKAHVDDLVHLCDQAARALDERVGHTDSIFATG